MTIDEAQQECRRWGLVASFPMSDGGFVRGSADADTWSITVFVGEGPTSPLRRHIAYMLGHEAAHCLLGHQADNLTPEGARQEQVAASCGLRYAHARGERLSVGRARWEGELALGLEGPDAARERCRIGRDVARALLA